MFELPLFPLNTVLFPGMPISLHIFEERYKQMIGQCIEQRKPFGVVLIKEGREALGPAATPHSVGCTAQITRVLPLTGGRMNIVAVGQERFRVLSLAQERPYLVALAELYPLGDTDTLAAARGAQRLRPIVIDYLQMLKDAGQIQFDPNQLPRDAQSLVYLSAVLLQVPTAQKQPLLAAERLTTLLDTLRGIYRRELALLAAMKTWSENDSLQQGPFSVN